VNSLVFTCGIYSLVPSGFSEEQLSLREHQHRGRSSSRLPSGNAVSLLREQSPGRRKHEEAAPVLAYRNVSLLGLATFAYLSLRVPEKMPASV
jgi:hypothetical protein